MNTDLVIGNSTDLGNARSTNQDFHGAYSGRFGTLVIVCDGMGGEQGGEVASLLAVESIRNHFETLDSTFDPRKELRNAFVKANERVLALAATSPNLAGMGTTAVVLLIRGEEAYVGHAGDSRAYLFRMSKVHRLTKDHSLVQQLIDAEVLTPEEAKGHPKRTVIVKVIGAGRKEVDPDISQPIALFRNDKFLLCSDGLTNYVDDFELLQVVARRSPQVACEQLVKLAKERGGGDNITVQVLEVRTGRRMPSSKIRSLRGS